MKTTLLPTSDQVTAGHGSGWDKQLAECSELYLM